ncbi:hypothetical protein, conserved in T. vivax [Trypanosoma vivax Y486]|uniref:Uncharacterized protein n=1 Tax=Trypanosoma vivax (strain Y486) TaxID=1055687 RepID=F9WQ69_TRYVY|nr:hypothetical protein, conserved in T. vivax [Trypanosoma vivax Y486]|eukprot:CCD19696.1 hypothetical protein, conserved in T. vivax [Trypanosoma vivax Y486]
MLEDNIAAVLKKHAGKLPNLTETVLDRDTASQFGATDGVATGVVTADDDTEGQACPLVVYRSKADQKHGGIIAGKGPKERTLIWGRWWKVTPAHHNTANNHDGPATQDKASEITIDTNATQTWHAIKRTLEALRGIIANVKKECKTEAGNLCQQITEEARQTLKRMATAKTQQAESNTQTTRNKGDAQQHNGHPQEHDTDAGTSPTCPTGTRWNQGTDQCETDGTGKAPHASSAHSTSARKTVSATLLLATLRTTRHI